MPLMIGVESVLSRSNTNASKNMRAKGVAGRNILAAEGCVGAR